MIHHEFVTVWADTETCIILFGINWIFFTRRYEIAYIYTEKSDELRLRIRLSNRLQSKKIRTLNCYSWIHRSFPPIENTPDYILGIWSKFRVPNNVYGQRLNYSL